jgi:hypothetical protein
MADSTLWIAPEINNHVDRWDRSSYRRIMHVSQAYPPAEMLWSTGIGLALVPGEWGF